MGTASGSLDRWRNLGPRKRGKKIRKTSGASLVIARRRIALASRTEGLTKIMDTRYAVIDIQDGKIVAIRKTRRAALILADKKDQAYGMYRYQVKRIENV